MHKCDKPHCKKELDISKDDIVMLDLPDSRVLIFCDLKCLSVWVDYHKETGFREVNMQRTA